MPTALHIRVAYKYLTRKASALVGSRMQIANKVNKALQKANTKGQFRDSYWAPIQRIWKELEAAGIEYAITKSEYEKENGDPIRKVWAFEVPFTTPKGSPMVVYGRVVANGVGPVKDPLSVYDVDAYAN